MEINKRIGFPLRFLAFIIDNFFISILSIILINLLSPQILRVFSQSQELLKLFTAPSSQLTTAQSDILNSLKIFNSYLAGITIIYMLVEAYFGASFGKKLLSLQITNLKGQLSPGKRYILRYVLKNISGLSFILATSLGFRFILTFGQFLGTIIYFGFLLTIGSSAMGIHDIISGTCVIHKRDLQTKGDDDVPGD